MTRVVRGDAGGGASASPCDQSLGESYQDAWKRRGRQLNGIYDALTAIVGESPSGDPVEDLQALGVELKRLREIEEAAREVPGSWDDFLNPPGMFSEGNDWRNAKEDAGHVLNVNVNRLRALLDGVTA